MKTVLFVLLDEFADWEAAFLAPALRGGVMPGRREATPCGMRHPGEFPCARSAA